LLLHLYSEWSLYTNKFAKANTQYPLNTGLSFVLQFFSIVNIAVLGLVSIVFFWFNPIG